MPRSSGSRVLVGVLDLILLASTQRVREEINQEKKIDDHGSRHNEAGNADNEGRERESMTVLPCASPPPTGDPEAHCREQQRQDEDDPCYNRQPRVEMIDGHK